MSTGVRSVFQHSLAIILPCHRVAHSVPYGAALCITVQYAIRHLTCMFALSVFLGYRTKHGFLNRASQVRILPGAQLKRALDLRKRETVEQTFARYCAHLCARNPKVVSERAG